MKNLIGEVIHRVVTSDKVAELWDRPSRIAQEQVEQVLTRLQRAAQGRGVGGPHRHPQGGPAAPTDAGCHSSGNITVPKVDLDVMQSDTIAQVQTVRDVFDRLATILPWLTLLILGAGILARPGSPRRPGPRGERHKVIGSLLLLSSVSLWDGCCT